MRTVRMTLMVLLASLASGCVFVVEKDSAVGVEFTSGLKAYQTAPDDGSKMELDVLPWVREEIKARRVAEAVEDDG